MIRPRYFAVVVTGFVSALLAPSPAKAQYAAAIVSYDAGTTAAREFGTNLPYDIQSSALGEPSRITPDASFPGIVSPFSPPYKREQFLSVGEGGHVTLRLSHYAIPQLAGTEIGVFTNAGITYDFINGHAESPAGTFGEDDALVEVSADGIQWVSLNKVTFELPTNGYTDLTDPFSATAGSALADFQTPLTASVSDFGGLPYADAGGPDVLELLAGSGGGTWLDISGTGLAQVGFIRFSVTDDGNSFTSLNFEVDAVSIAHAAMGAPVVPESATIMLCALGFLWPVTLRRRPAESVG